MKPALRIVAGRPIHDEHALQHERGYFDSIEVDQAMRRLDDELDQPEADVLKAGAKLALAVVLTIAGIFALTVLLFTLERVAS